MTVSPIKEDMEPNMLQQVAMDTKVGELVAESLVDTQVCPIKHACIEPVERSRKCMRAQ